jgi:glycosyltransferase involved in cell wall biosynthesis
MKVILASPGTGHVFRGYEIVTSELFRQLKGHLDIVLFKGAGRSHRNEYALPALRREWLTAIGLDKHAYRLEQLTFIPGLLAYLLSQHQLVVHVTDSTLARALMHARKRFNLQYTVLFCNGGGYAIEHCLGSGDYIHQVSQPAYEAALVQGAPTGRMFFLPHGIDFRRYEDAKEEPGVLRQKYGIPVDAFVVLAVGAINSQKRVEHVIQAVHGLQDPSVFLLVVGGTCPESERIVSAAKQLLGEQCQFLTVPYQQMHEIYRLADVFVHAALSEGFGLAIIEAIACGLPVVTHHTSHFRWLVGMDPLLVDMTSLAQVTERLRMIRDNRSLYRACATACCAHAKQNFDWSVLREQYIQTYAKISAHAFRRARM